jgi:hypothetical protein
MQCRG